MTVLRARALDAQNQPRAGVTATLEPFTGNRYNAFYGGPSATRKLSATSGSDGWLTWTLPDPQRRPGPKGLYWVIRGLETQPVVAATQPSDGTVTLDQRRVGTLTADGSLLVPPSVDTASAAVDALTTGAPASLDTLAEIAAELQGRLSDPALRSPLPTVGSFTYNPDGTIASDPDGNTYTWNTDGTPKTQTKGGVTRTYTWNTDGTLRSVS
jgi:hypothetical protein